MSSPQHRPRSVEIESLLDNLDSFVSQLETGSPTDPSTMQAWNTLRFSLSLHFRPSAPSPSGRISDRHTRPTGRHQDLCRRLARVAASVILVGLSAAGAFAVVAYCVSARIVEPKIGELETAIGSLRSRLTEIYTVGTLANHELSSALDDLRKQNASTEAELESIYRTHVLAVSQGKDAQDQLRSLELHFREHLSSEIRAINSSFEEMLAAVRRDLRSRAGSTDQKMLANVDDRISAALSPWEKREEEKRIAMEAIVHKLSTPLVRPVVPVTVSPGTTSTGGVTTRDRNRYHRRGDVQVEEPDPVSTQIRSLQSRIIKLESLIAAMDNDLHRLRETFKLAAEICSGDAEVEVSDRQPSEASER